MSLSVPDSVLIVDDHAGFRRRASQLLVACGLVVVGEAGDGADALRLHRRLHPDLVLLDVQLPDVDGIALIPLLLAEHPAGRVVLVSARDRSSYGDRLPAHQPFLRKDELTGPAIHDVLAAS